jgi:hypothetical protein
MSTLERPNLVVLKRSLSRRNHHLKLWPYKFVQYYGGDTRKPGPLAPILAASMAFLVGMGFVVASSAHAAPLARPQAEASAASAGLASFTPAVVVGVGLWGASVRRRRAIQTASPKDLREPIQNSQVSERSCPSDSGRGAAG